MTLSGGLKIVGLVLFSWAVSSFAQSSVCQYVEQPVTAYANYSTTINSPNYPGYYKNNLNCTWLITVEDSLKYNGYIIKVTFSDFQLSRISLTPCIDKLQFFDGMSAVSSVLRTYCGTTHPDVIYSSGQYLYVKFVTGFSYGRGFSLRVSAVKEGIASGICRPWDNSYTVHVLNGTSGTLFSPDYPVPYPDDVTCTWTITVPEGKIVRLKFENINLGKTYERCKEQSTDIMDYVKIGDGSTPDNKELGLYCGYYNFHKGYPQLYSSGRSMWVQFHSTRQKRWRRNGGFKAHFEAVNHSFISRDLCYMGNPYNNELRLNGSYGTLQSPHDSNIFDYSCDWLITVPIKKRVKLSFERFKLMPLGRKETICTEQFVEVIDGNERGDKAKGKFCGDSTPDDIYSTGRFMLVLFRVNVGYLWYDGFKATFTAEDKPMSTALIVGIVVGVIVFVFIVCCVVCKCKRKPSSDAGEEFPMSTTLTVAPHTTQPGEIQHPPPPTPPIQPPLNPYPPPPVGYAPVPTNPPPLAEHNPYLPYPTEPPPPYPGNETVPQYPPLGQSYSWVQSEPAKASAPPESP